MKERKILIIGIIMAVVLLFSLGITYAIFNYVRTGTNNSQLIVGDIYMHYNETNELTITNAMPYSISYKHNSNITEEEVNLCVDYLTSYWGPEEDNTWEGETYESFCQGTGTNYGNTFQQILDLDENVFYKDALIYFEENNIIIGQEGIAITDYDASCGSDVVIPKSINGYPVTNISLRAFQRKGLTSVVIPNSVKSIKAWAFTSNRITSVIIPDSVTYLSCGVFDDFVEIIKRDDLVCDPIAT